MTTRQQLLSKVSKQSTQYKANDQSSMDFAARQQCTEKEAKHPDEDKQTHRTDKEMTDGQYSHWEKKHWFCVDMPDCLLNTLHDL